MHSLIYPKQLDVSFSPTFDDELTPDPSIIATCKNDSSCISDALISGLVSMGVATQSGIAAVQDSVAQISEIYSTSYNWINQYFFIFFKFEIGKSPPEITFLNTSLRINWAQTTPLTILASVTDQNPITSIVLNITNANKYTTSVQYLNVNKTSAMVTITYTPTSDEYPNFLITVNDSQSLTASASLTGILICDCQRLDSGNTCIFESIQTIINPSISKVSCSCLHYYFGNYF